MLLFLRRPDFPRVIHLFQERKWWRAVHWECPKSLRKLEVQTGNKSSAKRLQWMEHRLTVAINAEGYLVEWLSSVVTQFLEATYRNCKVVGNVIEPEFKAQRGPIKHPPYKSDSRVIALGHIGPEHCNWTTELKLRCLNGFGFEGQRKVRTHDQAAATFGLIIVLLNGKSGHVHKHIRCAAECRYNQSRASYHQLKANTIVHVKHTGAVIAGVCVMPLK